MAAAAAFAAAGLAHGQASAPAAAPSPAKQALIAKVLQLMQPGVENMARQLAEQPALQLQQGAGQALQRVPAERREALARDLEADLRKYVDEAVPVVREKAARLAPPTLSPLLDDRFSEDELKQIVAILESPVNRKFQQTFPEMQRLLGERLVAETRGDIEPKVRALDQQLAKRLGIGPAASAPAGGGAAPAAAPAPRPAASGARR